MAQQLISKNVALFGLVVVLLGVLLACQQASQVEAFEMVQTGKSIFGGDGKQVKVNVPLFFNMELNTRGGNKGIKLDESVLGGFVKVSMDRENSNGTHRGPIKVSVGGITVYDNRQEALPA